MCAYIYVRTVHVCDDGDDNIIIISTHFFDDML